MFRVILIVFITLLIYSRLYAEKIKITKNNGNIVLIDLSEISNITFTLENSSMHDYTILSKIPMRFLKNYPNPFNPSTIISYDISKISDIDLTIYNSKGETVIKEKFNNQKIGSHIFKFDGSKYNSGVYFYSISIDGISQTKKMIMIK